MEPLKQIDPMLPAKMNLLTRFFQEMEYSRKDNGDDVVEVIFSAYSAIEDPERREEILASYSELLTELVPRMVEKLPYPVVFDGPYTAGVHEAGCANALKDALTHLRAILEGTHHFSEKLAVNPCQDTLEDEANARYISRGVIRLVVKHIEPGRKSVSVFTYALLYDKEADVDGHLYPIDSDPRPDPATT